MGALSNAIATLNPYLFYKCEALDATLLQAVDATENRRHLQAFTARVNLCAGSFGPYKAHSFPSQTGGLHTAVDFVGLQASRTVNDTDPLLNVADVTVSALIRLDADVQTQSYFLSIDESGENLSSNILFSLWFTQDSGNKVYYFHEYSTGANITGTLGPALTAGEVYHVVLRRAAYTKTYSWFVNGTKYDVTYSNNPEKASSGNLQWLKIGGSSTADGRPLDAIAFSQLALWNSALTDQQIADLYAAWEADQPAQALSISGFVKLDGEEANARVLLLESETGALRAITQSDPVSGYYAFEDVTGAVMAPGEGYFVLCDYGQGVRPLAHGPIIPLGGDFEWWTPANANGLAFWVDALDSDSMTISDTDVVSVWADKSGFGRNLVQATFANRPRLKPNVYNGKQAVLFDGSNDLMSVADWWGTNSTQAVTIFVVGGVTFSKGADGSGDGWSLTIPATYFAFVFDTGTIGAVGYSTGSGSSPAPNVRVGQLVPGTGGRTWENGVAIATTAATEPYWRDSTVGWRFGVSSSGVYSNGHLGECVMVHGVLPDSERQKFEGYLAHKWGFAIRLPNNHPYKAAPPVV